MAKLTWGFLLLIALLIPTIDGDEGFNDINVQEKLFGFETEKDDTCNILKSEINELKKELASLTAVVSGLSEKISSAIPPPPAPAPTPAPMTIFGGTHHITHHNHYYSSKETTSTPPRFMTSN